MGDAMAGPVPKAGCLNIHCLGLVCAAALTIALLLSASAARSQSAELMEAYERFRELYAEGRYGEAVPFAEEALKLGEREYDPGRAPFEFTLGQCVDCAVTAPEPRKDPVTQ